MLKSVLKLGNKKSFIKEKNVMKKWRKVMKIIGIIIFVIAICGVVFLLFWKPLGQGIFVSEDNYAQKTDLYYDGTFHDNPEISVMNGKESEFHNEQTIPNKEIPIHRLNHIPKANINDLKWVWFGHSSSMLQIQGFNVLIDPVFSEYSSPVQGFGPKRFSKVPIDKKNLPNIDVLVISHDHYDHMDYHTIIDIDDKVKNYCVPLGIENHLKRWGIDEKKIHVMAWWDEVSIDGLKIIATPGRHYTGRLPWQSNTTLWCGFIFQNEQYQAYYTGDTGYGNHFKEIYDKFGAMDLLILEDGQYDQSWESIHLLPKQGIQAVKDIHAKWTVPVHWGTFSISYHAWDDPIKQITTFAKQENLNVATPMIGQIIDYHQIQNYQEHWWEE